MFHWPFGALGDWHHLHEIYYQILALGNEGSRLHRESRPWRKVSPFH